MREPARAERVFRRVYERLNARVYGGSLPPFPGVSLTRATVELAATRTEPRRAGGRVVRVLLPFRVSRYVDSTRLLEELARHETAHAAAVLFDGEAGHGARWRAHAQRCGALVVPHLGDAAALSRKPVAVVSCERCDWRRPYWRRAPVLAEADAYRCAACRGRLVVTERDRGQSRPFPQTDARLAPGFKAEQEA